MKRFLIFGLLSLLSIVLYSFKSAYNNAKPDKGQELYELHCSSCHMANGEGVEGVFPPLAKSDYMMADKKRSIQQVTCGASGEMTVNGVKYNMDMPAQGLEDQEVADVLNYIRNAWGNPELVKKSKVEMVTAQEVKVERENCN